MYKELVDKKAKLAVIGLGYVGLPIALEFAKKISVIGFDINAKRISMMRNNQDPSKEVDSNEFKGKRYIVFTDDLEVLKKLNFLLSQFLHQLINTMYRILNLSWERLLQLVKY